jgi:flagellar biosynthesis protein FliQ
MSIDVATDVVREALMVTLIIGGPVLAVGLVVGLVVSILQAATQVQDQTLSLVPKILAMAAALIVLTPWIATRLIEFTQRMWGP